MTNAYVTGLGTYLPNEPVDNDAIEDVLGHVNQRSSQVKRWVLEHNGIQTRYYAIDPQTGEPTHTNAQMTAEAVRAAADNASLPLDDLECLVCGTSSADQVIPSHASMVHAELGGPPCEAVATTGVCCSGMSAFKYGFMNVASGSTNNAIVTGSEQASITLRSQHFEAEMEYKLHDLEKEPALAFHNDFLRWMLSDGAGAAVIANEPRNDGNPSLRIDWVDLVSYANEAPTCMYAGGVKQEDGSLVGYRTVTDAQQLMIKGYMSLAQDVTALKEHMTPSFMKAFQRSRQRHSLEADEIDWVLPHYSSDAFREPLYNGLVELGCEIPMERWFTNLPYKGNIGSASIYAILDELVSSGRVQRDQRLVCLVPESARFTFAVMHLTVV